MTDTIKLTWNNVNYFITRARLMRARATIESAYPLVELVTHMQNNAPHLVQLSMAYGALLRYLGANVEDEEIYEGMFGGDSQLGTVAATTLFQIMVPQKLVDAGVDGPQTNPTSRSKTSSKSRSVKAG